MDKISDSEGKIEASIDLIYFELFDIFQLLFFQLKECADGPTPK